MGMETSLSWMLWKSVRTRLGSTVTLCDCVTARTAKVRVLLERGLNSVRKTCGGVGGAASSEGN
jgi:hypothetical protein